MKPVSFKDFCASFSDNKQRLIVQLGIGRSGSLMLQSLFDGHSSVFMYPGILNFYSEIMPNLEYRENWLFEVEKSLNLWWSTMNAYNFCIKPDGEAIESPVQHVVNDLQLFFSDHKPERKTLYLRIIFATAKFYDEDLSAKKVLYTHEHHSDLKTNFFKIILEDFSNARFICTVRDPRSNYLSTLNWENKRKIMQPVELQGSILDEAQHEERCWHWYERYLPILDQIGSKLIIVRLEDLQAGKEKYVRSLCDSLDIEFENCLLTTTNRGYTWSGDNFSNKKSGFRNSANKELWQSKMSPVTQAALEILLHDEIKAFNYQFNFKQQFFWKSLAYLTLPIWNYCDYKDKLSKEYFIKAKTIRQQSHLINFLKLVRAYYRSLVRIISKVLKPHSDYPQLKAAIFKFGDD